MARFGALNGATTSGVEQSFTILKRVISEGRDHMDIKCELDELLLNVDCGRHEHVDELVRIAEIQWTKFFGHPRCRSNRVTYGPRQLKALS